MCLSLFECSNNKLIVKANRAHLAHAVILLVILVCIVNHNMHSFTLYALVECSTSDIVPPRSSPPTQIQSYHRLIPHLPPAPPPATRTTNNRSCDDEISAKFESARGGDRREALRNHVTARWPHPRGEYCCGRTERKTIPYYVV